MHYNFWIAMDFLLQKAPTPIKFKVSIGRCFVGYSPKLFKELVDNSEGVKCYRHAY